MLKQETKATHNARTKIPAGRSALAYIGLDYNSHEPAKTTKRAKKKKNPHTTSPLPIIIIIIYLIQPYNLRTKASTIYTSSQGSCVILLQQSTDELDLLQPEAMMELPQHRRQLPAIVLRCCSWPS